MGAGPGREPRRWIRLWIHSEGEAKKLCWQNERRGMGWAGQLEDAEWDSQGSSRFPAKMQTTVLALARLSAVPVMCRIDSRCREGRDVCWWGARQYPEHLGRRLGHRI